MPGFYVNNTGIDIDLINYYDDRCIKEEMGHDSCVVKRNTLDKFLDDKAFGQNKTHIVVSEGVLLNKMELFELYRVCDVTSLIIEMKNKEGERFFNKFRGNFSGALYDKATKEWLIWTNHFGDNTLFYHQGSDCFFIGSQVNYLLAALRKAGIAISFDEQAAYDMLIYGFMQDDRTYAQEIKRLLPGHYLKVTTRSFVVQEYWEVRHGYYNLSDKEESDIIEAMDGLFRSAVKREYEKDREYGYAHLSELSGGLDSRTANWVAHELGYSNILNVTISQSNYLDETIAKEIAVAIGNDHIVKTMDNAKFLFEIDELSMMNAGLSTYDHTAGKWLFQDLCMNRYGLIHTGLLGDQIVGSVLKTEDELGNASPAIFHSHVLKDQAEEIDLLHHQNREIYLFNTVGLSWIATKFSPRRNYSEIASPFLDVDFLEFCYSIPVGLRVNHKLYKKWLIGKMPAAAEYTWEREGVPLTASSLKRFIHKVVRRGPDKVKRLLNLSVKRQAKGKTMNPYDYWYETNESLRNFMRAYFDSNIENEIISPKLRQDMRRVYFQGSAFEKTQVLAVLGAVKLYFA